MAHKPCPGTYPAAIPCGLERGHAGDCGPNLDIPRTAWFRVTSKVYADGRHPNEVKNAIEEALIRAGETASVTAIGEV